MTILPSTNTYLRYSSREAAETDLYPIVPSLASHPLFFSYPICNPPSPAAIAPATARLRRPSPATLQRSAQVQLLVMDAGQEMQLLNYDDNGKLLMIIKIL
ncbi:hypothetical protein L2E82_02901 [Cichorium intybus]|uniref:Uncharacterized protein n=1 Tax=Cichorium intybus TaxID=13427 RepID=A0ACB9H2M7_CICIN|nr:hypothetical protein L2E82_02901 [Cichorium intybus]